MIHQVRREQVQRALPTRQQIQPRQQLQRQPIQ